MFYENYKATIILTMIGALCFLLKMATGDQQSDEWGLNSDLTKQKSYATWLAWRDTSFVFFFFSTTAKYTVKYVKCYHSYQDIHILVWGDIIMCAREIFSMTEFRLTTKALHSLYIDCANSVNSSTPALPLTDCQLFDSTSDCSSLWSHLLIGFGIAPAFFYHLTVVLCSVYFPFVLTRALGITCIIIWNIFPS